MLFFSLFITHLSNIPSILGIVFRNCKVFVASDFPKFTENGNFYKLNTIKLNLNFGMRLQVS